MKKNIIYSIISFLYLGLISYLLLYQFININFLIFGIIILVASIINTFLYMKYNYNIDQTIFKFRKILILLPIVAILISFSIIGFREMKLRQNNTKTEEQFKDYKTYLDLSNYQKNLIYKIDEKTKKVLLLKEKDKKKYYQEFKRITYEEISEVANAAYTVYEKDNFYLFVKKESPKESYVMLSLEDKYLYKLNIDYTLIEKDAKYFEVKKITNKTKYLEIKINDKIHLGKQESDNYNIFRQYYKDFYSLHKNLNIKKEIKKLYPDYKSLSYTSTHTNVGLPGNQIIKVTASFNEKFELILEEN